MPSSDFAFEARAAGAGARAAAPASADAPGAAAIEAALDAALAAVLAEQRPDGHWVYELEADATIPAEYVLMVHYLGETPDPAREAAIGRYLRRIQGEHGGWPLFHGGAFDPSASVKAYFALKMIGDAPDAPHMARARAAILAHGGAARSNVFTRILLALYGQVPWSAVPTMPVEIVLLPGWFPFHLSRVSYWTRTVLVPLLVLGALRPRARNPRAVGIAELFTTPPAQLALAPRAPHQHRLRFALFRTLERALRALDLPPHGPNAPSATSVTTPAPPRPRPGKRARLRQRALVRARAWVRARLNGEHGLGGIFPAMVNAVLMLDALGESRADPAFAQARRAIDLLLVEHGDEAYCQPCVSPVWDTALMCHALLETGAPDALDAARRGLAWLRPRQVLDKRGDWSVCRPGVRPGGWAFQYANALYPDVDDTAVVALAMHRFGRTMGAHEGAHQGAAAREALARAREWVIGMQSRCGGWGAFDADNTRSTLNDIPFADHGALLDPPTADVSARCLSMLAQLDPGACARRGTAARRALNWLLRQQERDGSWYGRWGVNYVYGTWSALCALHAAGLCPGDAPVARAAAWLTAVQNADGGWGEDGDSYRLDRRGYAAAPSTPSQTAWALLGLMAAGAVDSPAVARGAAWLLAHQRADGLWDEPQHTATGFPCVFYLRYHGYAHYFPLWALARYRRLRGQGGRRPGFGI